MRICRTISEMQQACRELKRSTAQERGLGFVPTMGALHVGHLSLVAAARAECDAVVASIFVNPRQFGVGEDYEIYPREFEEDCRKLESAGVEILFAPTVDEMYRPGATTFVEVAGISDRLDGASRPGHFRGVATVVVKLFNIVGPDKAYFGQKDAAQVAVLRAMVRDLNFPVELIACTTAREDDGLAMSSRNRYLSAEERQRALVLSHALQAAKSLAKEKGSNAQMLREAMLQKLTAEPLLRIDYAAVVDADTLEPIEDLSNGALVALAAWFGKTRLIDNVLLEPVTHV
ncbi:pantoate--beta-alanine ligase [Granulicella mallensis]|uniref:Pantothenate synthetase n=1 Tax=Granulicella mallensis (strain ATCC BAA-1857 / DSM 23137 / MP5ACTX8) TaxID=682795 RepID=G8P0T1_GRAMM|nr:pantoate--beta-alanine ligase [Granulicella mallensis]AEU35778.1 pantoate/beta-alanine ligase [Granulicella mallensis MP5ACTX8]